MNIARLQTCTMFSFITMNQATFQGLNPGIFFSEKKSFYIVTCPVTNQKYTKTNLNYFSSG